EASGFVRMSQSTVAAVRERRTPKGDPLEAARLAGIMAAKRTGELIPLCHPLALTHADVQIALEENGARITATASTSAQTGVEMEALTAVSVAALTLYDMLKAVDRGMLIGEIRLERKSGGMSGEWTTGKQRSRIALCAMMRSSTLDPRSSEHMNAALKNIEAALTEHYGWSSSPALREKIGAAVEVKAGRLRVAPEEYCRLAASSFSEMLALVEE